MSHPLHDPNDPLDPPDSTTLDYLTDPAAFAREVSRQRNDFLLVSDLTPALVGPPDIAVIAALSHTIKQKIVLSLYSSALESSHAPYQFLLENRRIVGASIHDPTLSHFPQVLFDLAALQTLSVTGTLIEIFPLGLSRLPNLTRLALSWNKLIQFPEEVLELPHLQSLSLNNNQISHLPAGLRTHPSLTDFVIDNNPLRSLSGYPAKCLLICEYIHCHLTWRGWILALLPTFETIVRYDNELPRFIVIRGNFFAMTPEGARLFCDQMEQAHSFLNFPLPLTSSDPVLPGPGQFSISRPPTPYHPMIPAFKARLLEVLTHIGDYSVDSWREYYAKHPFDLARQYIHSRPTPTASNSGSHTSVLPLTAEELHRLRHEADYKVFTFLQSHLHATDPLLQTLSERFSEETGSTRIYL